MRDPYLDSRERLYLDSIVSTAHNIRLNRLHGEDKLSEEILHLLQNINNKLFFIEQETRGI